MIADLEAIPPADCLCGQARRAFLVPENTAASIHLVDIKTDPEVHYHDKHTEIYYVIEGEGFIELDGERTPVKPETRALRAERKRACPRANGTEGGKQSGRRGSIPRCKKVDFPGYIHTSIN
jgi:hypothetical protein